MCPTNFRAGIIRELCIYDEKRIFEWRNHSEIRKWMCQRDEIDANKHHEWFISIKNNTKKPYIYEEGCVPLGYVCLDINISTKVAEWGFYVAPYATHGVGQRMCASLIEYAFNTIKLNKIYGRVLACNSRSIKLHYKLGFKLECCLREQVLYEGVYSDLLVFGLLRKEWK